MSSPECRIFRDVAAEVALGIAVGDERAGALEHSSHCARCRRDLDGLTATLDALLSAAPTIEPPHGFGDRAVAAFAASAPPPPTRRHRRRVALVAALVVVTVAASVVGAVLLRDGTSRAGTAEVAETLSGTRSTHRWHGPLTTPEGAVVGAAVVTRAPSGSDRYRSSELVVTLQESAPEGTYQVECDDGSGHPYTVGELRVTGAGPRRWSASVSVPTDELRRVRLVSTTGAANLEAEMAT